MILLVNFIKYFIIDIGHNMVNYKYILLNIKFAESLMYFNQGGNIIGIN